MLFTHTHMNALASSESAAAPDTIPLSEPRLGGNEWKYVKECLDTGWVSSAGAFVDRFERELAGYVKTSFGVATVNGTSALHTSLLVAGVAPENEVLVSGLTFIAPANAIRYAGAWPVFIDAEPTYWQMDPERVVDFLEHQCKWRAGRLYNRVTERQIKAILPVHILGHPVDIDPIVEVARKYDLAVIEDATESLGAKYKGRMVGSLGDIAAFSFNGNKIITTGGGGMIVTSNEEWAVRARYLTTQAKDDPVEYVHNAIGYNYRLTNLQAAMGCAQLEQLAGFLDSKRRTASGYAATFKDQPGLSTMIEAPWAESSFWLYTILLDGTHGHMDSRALLGGLQAVGIQSRPLWRPLPLNGAFRNCECSPCPVAECLFRDALSLPSSVGLSDENREVVTSAILRILRDAR